MIIHRHQNGSEAYEFELGDIVEITGVVPSGEWFKRVIGRTGSIVEIGREHWRIAFLHVRHDPDWGPSHCAHWQVKPTPETYAAAEVVAT